jgi:glycosyltransferase involved in cell wall biosynthesis
LRLCFLTRDYALYPPFGGVATYVRDAAQWLVSEGHGVQVVCVNRRHSAHVAQDGLVKVHFVGPKRIRPRTLVNLAARLPGLQGLSEVYSGWDLLENSLGGWSMVDKLAREAPFDLIECDDYEGKAFWGLWPRHRYRVVLRGHGIIHLDLPFAQYRGARFHHQLEVLCADRADFILTAAQYLVDSYCTELGLRHNRIVSLALPMAVDEMAQRYVKAERTDDQIIILYVGRLEHRKGTDFLFTALKDVRQRGTAIHCILVGAPEAEFVAQLDDFMGSSGSWVTYAGALPQSQVFEYMARADMLVLPSRTETLPRVLIEAQALGLPQIATRVGGIPEIVEEGVTGFLVDVGDAVMLADAIMKLCLDPQLRESMAEASRVRASARYNVNAIMSRQLEVYRCIADGGKPEAVRNAAKSSIP